MYVQNTSSPNACSLSPAVMLQMHGFLIAGDLIFSGSVGRTDFPYSDPKAMAASLRRIMQLPDETKVFCFVDRSTWPGVSQHPVPYQLFEKSVML
jgi:glyoxylase-like metal-dependent hydrolase (beta-lactamase superfamily II)